VMVVTDDEWLNEVDGMRQEDYSKDWVMHIGKSDFEGLYCRRRHTLKYHKQQSSG